MNRHVSSRNRHPSPLPNPEPRSRRGRLVRSHSSQSHSKHSRNNDLNSLLFHDDNATLFSDYRFSEHTHRSLFLDAADANDSFSLYTTETVPGCDSWNTDQAALWRAILEGQKRALQEVQDPILEFPNISHDGDIRAPPKEEEAPLLDRKQARKDARQAVAVQKLQGRLPTTTTKPEASWITTSGTEESSHLSMSQDNASFSQSFVVRIESESQPSKGKGRPESLRSSRRSMSLLESSLTSVTQSTWEEANVPARPTRPPMTKKTRAMVAGDRGGRSRSLTRVLGKTVSRSLSRLRRRFKTTTTKKDEDPKSSRASSKFGPQHGEKVAKHKKKPVEKATKERRRRPPPATKESSSDPRKPRRPEGPSSKQGRERGRGRVASPTPNRSTAAVPATARPPESVKAKPKPTTHSGSRRRTSIPEATVVTRRSHSVSVEVDC